MLSILQKPTFIYLAHTAFLVLLICFLVPVGCQLLFSCEASAGILILESWILFSLVAYPLLSGFLSLFLIFGNRNALVHMAIAFCAAITAVLIIVFYSVIHSRIS